MWAARSPRGPRDRLAAGGGVRLGEDLFDVPFDRRLAEVELFGDLRAGQPLRDQVEDFELFGGQRRRCRFVLEGLLHRETLQFLRVGDQVGGGGAERLLGLPSFGDVTHDPDHADRLAAGVNDRLCAPVDDPDMAVGADHAELDADGRGARDDLIQSLADAFAIVGVHALRHALLDAFSALCRVEFEKGGGRL
jgi:hypothetical protein